MPRRIVGLLLALPVLALLGLAPAQSFTWLDVEQHVTIAEDGTIRVTDERTLVTSGDFGEAFLCIRLRPGQQVRLLEGSGAVGPGPPAEAFQQRCDGGTELVVRNQQRVQERRVRWVYELIGAVEAHGDVVEWYWNILERDHPPVRGFDLTVRAPGAMDYPYDAFVHRYANTEEPRVSLSDDRSTLRVRFERIPDGDGVEIRYLMDPRLFSISGQGTALERLLRDEARIAGVARPPGPGQQAALFLRRASAGNLAWIAYPLLALLTWLGHGVYRDYRRFGREADLGPAMIYPFEPPSDVPPAVVTVLGRQYGTSSTQTSRALHATIMDLARRGYATFDTRHGKVAMDLDLERSGEELEEFERDVLAYLREAAKGAGDEGRLSFAELKKYSEKRLKTFLSSWYEKVRAVSTEYFGGPLITEESHAAAYRWGLRIAIALFACFVLAIVTGGAATLLFLVAVGLLLVLLLTTVLALPRWRRHVLEEVRGWQGFRRTLRDYTRMKDAPDDFFGLWDRYYCYAAALGVAERFLGNLGRAMQERGLEPNRLGQTAWLPATSTRDFAQFSRSVSSISKALSVANASASSGGSGSGGGGGGGGGSSGGR